MKEKTKQVIKIGLWNVIFNTLIIATCTSYLVDFIDNKIGPNTLYKFQVISTVVLI